MVDRVAFSLNVVAMVSCWVVVVVVVVVGVGVGVSRLPAKSCQGERPSAGNAILYFTRKLRHRTSQAKLSLIIIIIIITTTFIHFTTIMHCLLCIATISAIGPDKHPWH